MNIYDYYSYICIGLIILGLIAFTAITISIQTSKRKLKNQTKDLSKTSVTELFQSTLTTRLHQGIVEEKLEKAIDVLIKDAVEDVFRSYGDIGKMLKEKLTKSIMPQIETMDDLPTYHEFVMNRIKLAAQNFYDERLTAIVDAELKNVFTELPEKITLSWLIEKVVEDARENSDGEYITLRIEDKSAEWSWSKPGDSIMLYLDKDENTKQRDCEFDLHLSKDKTTGDYQVLGIRVGGKTPSEKLCIGRIYNTQKILFNIFAMKGQINFDKGIDPDHYDTSYERECHCD